MSSPSSVTSSLFASLIVVFLAVQLLSAQETPTLIFPQIADGDGFRFELGLTNVGTHQDEGTIFFKDDDGNPLSIVVEGALRSSIEYSVPAGGAFTIQSDGEGSLKGGYATIVSDNTASLLNGNLVYEFNGKVSVAAAPLSKEYHALAELDASTDTGIAVVNLGASQISITIKLLRDDGSEVEEQTIQLSSGEHQARFISEMFPGAGSSFKGSIHLKSDSDFAMIALQQFSGTSLATVSSSPRAHPSLGFSASLTDDSLMGAIAVHQNGEKLVALTTKNPSGEITSVDGVVWVGPGGQSTTIVLGDNGLPTRAIVGDLIYLFDNYTGSSVDVAVITASGEIQIARDIPVDSSDISGLTQLSLGSRPLGFETTTGALWEVAKVMGLATQVVGCAVVIAKTAGLAAKVLGPPCVKAGIGLAGLAASLVVGDNLVLEGVSLGVAAIGCGTGLASV